MTEELFRADSYLKSCEAVVVSAGPEGIVLDRTVFYPSGGGQPGDSGAMTLADGTALPILDTRKGEAGILHVPAEGAALPSPGDTVTVEIDWERRHRHMRLHTAMHLLCASIAGGVTGGQIGDGKARLDFDLPEVTFTKEELTEKLAGLIAADHPVTSRWISDAEMAAQPELVRTMSVKPPSGSGKVRLMEVAGVDLQPCGGTHVARTGEIGAIAVAKIENKGKHNRRITIAFQE
ncbi:MAG: alanyl-tRNA editing protein [Alphaproteobacteria bacterium]|nr:alanyl-tRNA editing protein [Alphaproteobacteria bacterium]MBU0795961.1 alanyl-tRNA editing protein [Alphaproteobacteria bacterium]MBU0886490.1 alanyl-tRNA editing protein [Alphaproteobacteria bacterium]MBU1812287.1 alanyl-tRNA editing protein [Alphaproteobacteria bacterium]MBU2089972.1 alanyl-tRNA editing protein [Alphaproteobacteria bacterium]